MGTVCKWPEDGLLTESAGRLLLDDGRAFYAEYTLDNNGLSSSQQQRQNISCNSNVFKSPSGCLLIHPAALFRNTEK